MVGNIYNERIDCLEKNKIYTGYYNNNGIFYKCIKNCDICSDNKECKKCKINYEFINNQCILNMKNCQEYNEAENKCIKCIDNFAFNKTYRNICINISNFTDYYSKDEGISYYPCSESIRNCKSCYYDKNNSDIKCIGCKNDYNLSIFENKCLSTFNYSSISDILIEDSSNINEDFSTQLITNDNMITDAPIDFSVDLSDDIQKNNNKIIFLLQLK